MDTRKRERALDEAVDETFPASDPPASTGITGPGRTDQKPHDTHPDPAGTPEPKGYPTSDRYEHETAHHDEEDVKPTKP